MSYVLTIKPASGKLARAIEQLLTLGEYRYEVDAVADAPKMSWENLTADDYRAMIRAQVPEVKAKSFRNYEG